MGAAASKPQHSDAETLSDRLAARAAAVRAQAAADKGAKVEAAAQYFVAMVAKQREEIERALLTAANDALLDEYTIMEIVKNKSGIYFRINRQHVTLNGGFAFQKHVQHVCEAKNIICKHLSVLLGVGVNFSHGLDTYQFYCKWSTRGKRQSWLTWLTGNA